MPLVPIPHPSPNFGPRRGVAVDMLVFHYTGMWTAEDALARLCDAKAKVSCHYLIDEEGRVYALVEEHMRAWHAGVSSWAGDQDVNSRSIGIELVNKGHDLGYHDFSEAQMAALEEVARGIVARHRIPAFRVLGHSDVAPTRKVDPGEKFDWQRLAGAGVGLYPPAGLPKPTESPDRTRFLAKLARFGYGIGADAAAGTAAIEAFRRHFHAHALGNTLGIGDAARLDWLLSHLPAAV
ncbi:MAG: N-acetylmuramoyl-L-alanine amidase [Alphaproteobacteria bacterium]